MRISKPKFRLTSPDKDISGVYLDYATRQFGRSRFKYGCGVEVKTKYWKTPRVREVGSYSGDAKMINKKLETLDIALKDYVNSNTYITKEGLKHHLDVKSGRVIPTVTLKTSLVDWLENHVNTNPDDLKENTMRSKQQLIVKLRTFSTSSRFRVDFDTVNMDFRVKFIRYLEGEGLNKNSIWRYVKDLKAALRYAEEVEDIEIVKGYKLRRFSVPTEQSDNIYLTSSELSKLYKYDLSNKAEGYAAARDWFIVGSYTGLRYGDFISINPEHLIEHNGRTFLKKTTEKTSRLVWIPLRSEVLEVLERSPSRLPNQNINLYIKQVCKWCGISDKVLITKNGKEELFEKYQLVTTHTARRSFATNAYLSGELETLDIMSITGHKTEASFLLYIKVTAEQHAKRMADKDIFIGEAKMKIA